MIHVEKYPTPRHNIEKKLFRTPKSQKPPLNISPIKHSANVPNKYSNLTPRKEKGINVENQTEEIFIIDK